LSLTAFCDDANISLIKWQAPVFVYFPARIFNR